MTITQKTNHVEEALANIIDQYKGAPFSTAVLSAFVKQLQDVEDAYEDLKIIYDIASNEGVQLDRIGRVINEDRGGNEDYQYRLYLFSRVMVNKSEGTAEELIEIAKLLTNSRIVWEESYTINPADYATAQIIFVDAIDPLVVDIAKLAKIMNLAKPAGVLITLQFGVPDPFTWDTVDLGWDDGKWGTAI